MSILSHTYIFYADVYFIQNLIIKIAVIYLSLYCNKLHILISTRKGIQRIMFAAILGTVIEVFALFIGESYQLFLLLVHVLEIPFMMWWVLKKAYKQMFRVIIFGYFFIMLINAVVEIAWNWYGANGYYVFFLSAACVAVYAGTRIWKNYTRTQKGVFMVELEHEGMRISTYGFYDTGNHLTDPYTGRAVHIISENLCKQLQIKSKKEIYIPYQSLGKEQGLIKVYYLEHIRIHKEQNCIEMIDVPVGVAEDTLFQNKKYQMILNAEVS